MEEKNCKDYFVEEEQDTYYVYDNEDNLVYIGSSIQSLNDFCPGLGDMQDNKKPILEEKKIPKRGWNPDENMKKVVKYYRDWAGFGDDTVLTEDLLKNEDWRLKRVSSLKNVPVKQLKAALLQQKDSE